MYINNKIIFTCLSCKKRKSKNKEKCKRSDINGFSFYISGLKQYRTQVNQLIYLINHLDSGLNFGACL